MAPTTTSTANRTRALAPVRLALHGWAFSNDTAVKSMVKSAKALLSEVPEMYRAEAESLISSVESHLLKPR